MRRISTNSCSEETWRWEYRKKEGKNRIIELGTSCNFVAMNGLTLCTQTSQLKGSLLTEVHDDTVQSFKSINYYQTEHQVFNFLSAEWNARNTFHKYSKGDAFLTHFSCIIWTLVDISTLHHLCMTVSKPCILDLLFDSLSKLFKFCEYLFVNNKIRYLLTLNLSFKQCTFLQIAVHYIIPISSFLTIMLKPKAWLDSSTILSLVSASSSSSFILLR